MSYTIYFTFSMKCFIEYVFMYLFVYFFNPFFLPGKSIENLFCFTMMTWAWGKKTKWSWWKMPLCPAVWPHCRLSRWVHCLSGPEGTNTSSRLHLLFPLWTERNRQGQMHAHTHTHTVTCSTLFICLYENLYSHHVVPSLFLCPITSELNTWYQTLTKKTTITFNQLLKGLLKF